MTDHFRSKTQEILRAGDENGGLGNRSLFDLIVASHDDFVEEVEVVVAAVAVNTRRIDDLDCVKYPRDKRSRSDPSDSQFLEERESAHPDDAAFQTRFMWLVGSKFGNVAFSILGAVVAAMTIAYLIR